jgi:Na+-driven multidrug efflux pump
MSGQSGKKMTQTTTQLRYRDLLRKMIMLAIPTMVEQILSTLLQYVDTAMVGRLGEQATASVSVTTTIGWLVGSMAYAVGTAVLALVSRAYGANDRQKGHRIAGQALLLTLVSGIILGGISIALSPFIPVWMGAEKAIRHQASVYFTIISIPMVFRVSTAVLG